MTLNFLRRLVAAACLLLLSASCNDDSTGAGGTGGGAGVGGTPAEPPSQIPGLWEGESNGVDVCFYIGDDGLRLTPSGMCNVTEQALPGAVDRSFDLSVDLVGVDGEGQPCSFTLSFASEVLIDPVTNSFRASELQGDDEVAFSGEIIGDQASGAARRDSGESFCQVGWATTKSTLCDDAAIQSCLDLQDCCRAILVSPVFFESCNSVVLQCDQAQCLSVLEGYPRCAPDPEPEP